MTRIKDTMIMEQYHAAVSAMVRVALMFEGDLVGDEGAMSFSIKTATSLTWVNIPEHIK